DPRLSADSAPTRRNTGTDLSNPQQLIIGWDLGQLDPSPEGGGEVGRFIGLHGRLDSDEVTSRGGRGVPTTLNELETGDILQFRVDGREIKDRSGLFQRGDQHSSVFIAISRLRQHGKRSRVLQSESGPFEGGSERDATEFTLIPHRHPHS
ncbi:hypothetical protein PENTCL1PPCAC_346, partial [Pristionchus entomophagus]